MGSDAVLVRHAESDSPDCKDIDASLDKTETTGDKKEPTSEWKPDGRFWIIIASLSIACLVCGMENIIIVMPLPFIVKDLNLGASYVWVANIHFLTGAACMPIVGQLANPFGRRYPTIVALCVYLLGSGLCGGAKNGAMLLAGRAFQGAGGSGIMMMTEMIIADLAPVKQRASFIGMVMGIAGMGSMAAPAMGGAIVQHASWRWIFWLNLPVCSIALVLVFFFLRVKWNKTETFASKMARIDWIGNLLVMGATTSITIAFTWGGTIYPWKSAHVLAPLVIGILGLIAFVFWEGSPFVKEPILPLHLLSNRTSLILFINTFITNTLLYWTYFFAPVYFQGVLMLDPLHAAVMILPMSFLCVPTLVVTTGILSKTGRYKWIHVIGFAVWCGGIGAMSTLKLGDKEGKYIGVQIPAGLAVGFLLGTLLPAYQGIAPEKDQAAATASFTWVRAFSYVWGVSFSAIIFTAYIAKAANMVDDPSVRSILTNGDAFSSATKAFLEQYQNPVQTQIRIAFAEAFDKILQVAIGLTALGFLLALFEKDIELRTEIETEFGLEDRKTAAIESTATVV